jgi:hypothetical protein
MGWDSRSQSDARFRGGPWAYLPKCNSSGRHEKWPSKAKESLPIADTGDRTLLVVLAQQQSNTNRAQ